MKELFEFTADKSATADLPLILPVGGFLAHVAYSVVVAA
jgi:hypothetical protein